MSVITSRASRKDAFDLVIREEDLAEIALYGLQQDPHEQLAMSIEVSPDCWKANDARTGELLCIFGIGDAGGVKAPWLISAENLKNHGRDAIRIGKAVRENLQRQVDTSGVVVRNYVSKEALANRAFISRVGYVIEHVPDSPFDLFHLPPTCATHS